MLVKINSQEAFGLLINKDKCEYVFFKHNGNYEKSGRVQMDIWWWEWWYRLCKSRVL